MKILGLEEAAQLLRIHKSTAQAMAHDGKLPGAKIGRSWVFVEEDLHNYLRQEIDRQVKERAGRANDDAPRSEERPEPIRSIRPKRYKQRLPELPDCE